MGGSSDEQARRALADHRQRRVLHLEYAEGIFGGWAATHQQDSHEFEKAMSSMLHGSWCCSSWYKPSGSFPYPAPARVHVLPSGCGEDEVQDETQNACLAARDMRRAAQQPFNLNYVRDGGRDGYY